MNVVLIFAFDAPTRTIGCAAAILNLALVEGVQEIQSIAVSAAAPLAEIPTVFISILADTALINPIPFDTFVASILAIHHTVFILSLA